MKFSLILCTLGRVEEVGLFFESLEKQLVDFELIIVDQNEDNILYDYFCEHYSSLENRTNYIRTKEKGLSKSRNVGLKFASGDVICFPDDDCIYSIGLLPIVENIFNTSLFDILSIKSVGSIDMLSNNDFINIKKLTDLNIFKRAISYSLFFKRNSILGFEFDEDLGVGAEFGSTEESDFTLRVMLNGSKKNIYTESLTVYHPDKIVDYNNIDRMNYYSLGVGAFFKKHIMKSKFGIIVQMIKAFLGPILASFYYSIKKDKVKSYWYRSMLNKRLEGFKRYESKK